MYSISSHSLSVLANSLGLVVSKAYQSLGNFHIISSWATSTYYLLSVYLSCLWPVMSSDYYFSIQSIETYSLNTQTCTKLVFMILGGALSWGGGRHMSLQEYVILWHEVGSNSQGLSWVDQYLSTLSPSPLHEWSQHLSTPTGLTAYM